MVVTELAVETSGLVKVFGGTRAVDGVDLAVPTGGVYGFLGPNGAGKTTTIRMLATLLPPDGGTARVLGHDIVRAADAVRSRVRLTGQFASVDADLTGAENFILLARLLGYPRPRAKARAAALLDAFGLTDAAAKQVKHYSGGMRRRLDVAASIVVTPELVFLDEPTTGLDPRSRNQVWDIVRALVAEGTTVLLTTQYLEKADQLADRIAVIDHGKIIAEGTPRRAEGVGRRRRPARPAARPRAQGQRRGGAAVDPRRARAPGVRPGRAVRAGVGSRAGRGRAGRAGPRRDRGRPVRARPAQPERGLPRPDRPPGRGSPRSAGMTAMATTPATGDQVRAALATGIRPRRASLARGR
jgi:ABC-2 type transport system ATP-binding protein